MTPDQHDRVREIYEQALLIAGAAREQYLTRECADEAEIRGAVERLLDAHGRVPDWLDRPLLGAAPTQFAKLDGRVIGGYTLVREPGTEAWAASISPTVRMARFRSRWPSSLYCR